MKREDRVTLKLNRVRIEKNKLDDEEFMKMIDFVARFRVRELFSDIAMNLKCLSTCIEEITLDHTVVNDLSFL